MPKRAACTGCARAHFSKILHNLHSLYARETTKVRLRVMITCAQHSFGTLPPGIMFQTLPLSSRALEGLGTRLPFKYMRMLESKNHSKRKQIRCGFLSSYIECHEVIHQHFNVYTVLRGYEFKIQKLSKFLFIDIKGSW